METRPFGPARTQISAIGQGTWNLESGDRKQAIAALRQGIDLGMTHIDTAEMYGSGAAEQIVGEAIQGRREHIFLVSKVLPQNSSFEGTVRSCEASLKRLRTDYLDCYLLHWRGSHPLRETLRAFDELERDGKIRTWGVSNFDVPDLEEALALVGEERIACNQVLYHLQQRAIEHAVLPWCAAHGVALVAYSPFGQGTFPGPNTKGGRVLSEIARAHHATPRQVALRFLLRSPSVFVIPKAASSKHVAENAGASALRLADGELAQIGDAFPRPRSRKLPTL